MSSKHSFVYLPHFKRDYKKLSLEVKEKVQKAILRMGEDLKYPGLRVKKIKGTDSIWEARASQSVRLTFNLQGNTIILRTVGEHDILKRP
ncbi:MAG: hypothetical protein AUJ75_04700 [Candidatus Omnitrophica bacterium CG1_02_49_10]|nr:MAG: hypothetical protein AUJ75_04700 [Candidatus Omnitrophica bacterium CG1_02_49_10]